MAFLLALLLAASPALAQSSGDAAPERRLVKLNVAVRNSKGQPVNDLKLSDIRIKEDGKLQQVVFFRFAGNKSEPGPAIILLDRWNERMLTMASAWSEIRKGLQTVRPGEPVYLYFLNNKGDLIPIRALPGSEDIFADAGNSSRPLIDALDQAVRNFQGFRGTEAADPVLRTNLTLRALAELGVQMASIPGRKNLVWVTHGVPLTVQTTSMDWLDFTPRLRDFAAAAAQSQIAIYPVDESAAGAGADPTAEPRKGLQMLADLTGGRWYPSSASAQAIAESLNDARSYYTVAYYSQAADQQPKFRRIRRESDRKGVRFLTRGGYDAAQGDPDVDAWQEASFQNQRIGLFDAADIGVRAATVSRDPSTRAVQVELRVNPADLLMARRGGNYQAHLAILPALYSEGSFQRTLALTTMDVDLTPVQYAAAVRNGIPIARTLPAAGDADAARLMVFDRGLRSLGSVTLKLP